MPLEHPPYPVNLVLAGRRCLVVGGGRVAAQKVDGLIEAGARVHVIAVRVGDEIRRRAEQGGSREVMLTWEERRYEPGDVTGYRLVVAATDSPAVNSAVFHDADSLGIWVNSADDPANCTFTLPARVRQGPLLLTVSTAGVSPAAAKWIRRRLQVEFGPEYATLVAMLGAEREQIRSTGRTTEGLDWQGALDSGMLDLIREGNLAEAKERLQACLSSSSD